MAVRTRYVRTSSTAGGDGSADTDSGSTRAYPDLSTAEAAEQLDFVTANIQLDIVCSTGSGTAADATSCTIDGSTTNATWFIRIKPNTGHEAVMPFGTSIYRLAGTANMLGINDFYTRVERLQFELQTVGGTRKLVKIDSDGQGSRVVGCLLRNTGTDAHTLMAVEIQTTGSGNAFVIDCVGIGNGSNGIGLDVSNSNGIATPYVYNCTMVLSGTNYNGGAVTTLKNCLGAAKVTSDFAGTFTASYCASSDATADDNGGTGHRINQTFTFVNAGGGDYHLTSADAGARNFGTDLSADANFAFSTDFDGTSRPIDGAWDIGATEAPAAGFNAALMAAMDRPRPDIVFDAPQVVASGMTPPDRVNP